MAEFSKSPDRNTFQKDGYLQRMAEQGKTAENDESVNAMVEYYKSWNIKMEEQIADEAWRRDNLEWDLCTTDWILEKARASKSYAQNLYAAMCNTDWQRTDVVPILKDQTWSCSWRYAGGIIANMRQEGDYIDWYCSGIGGGDEPDVYQAEHDLKRKGYVPESVVTDEIREDLQRLGWHQVETNDE